jgi:ribosome assembly protein RRB1
MEVDGEVMPAIEESDEKPRPPNVFIPGLHTLGKDEILEADESVYVMRHTMNTDWPCLSFDVLRDDDGDQRQRFPASAYIVAGTQADAATKNQLTVFKMTQLHKTQKDGGGASSGFFFRSPSGGPQGSHCQRVMTPTLTTMMGTTWMRTPSSNIAPSHTLVP